MLKVSGLAKSFGKTEAVRGVSFTIERGCAYGLLGPNGAGKTTTISMIVGALSPDAGTVELEGERIGPKAKRRLGFVPQELALYEEISARDNLRFFAALYGGDPDLGAMEKVLDLVGLSDRANEPVKHFSGGMKRRLNIAVGLVHGPDFLVLDEPTVGVDPQSRNAIFEALERLKSEGMTLLYTTHYMEEVEKLCDRVAIMDHGSIIAEDDLQALYRLVPVRQSVTLDLVEAASAVGFVGGRLQGEALHLEFQNMEAELPAALERVNAAGIRYRSIHSDRATLEEVFLHLTGNRLRD